MVQKKDRQYNGQNKKGHTIKWPRKRMKDKEWSTRQKTKYWTNQTPLKSGMECSSCSPISTRRVTVLLSYHKSGDKFIL